MGLLMNRLYFLKTNLLIFGAYLLIEDAGCIFLVLVFLSRLFELSLNLLIEFFSGVYFLSDFVYLFLNFPIFLVLFINLISEHIKSVNHWFAFSFLKQFVFASSGCSFGRNRYFIIFTHFSHSP
jgi:hypothetical protein